MDKLTCPCSALVQLLALSLSFHGICTNQIASYLKELRIDEQIVENLSHNGCKTILILHALHKQKHVQSMEKHCILGNESIKKVPCHLHSLYQKKIFPFTEQIWNLRRKTEQEQHLLSPCPQPKKIQKT
jgi:hypothetical protein